MKKKKKILVKLKNGEIEFHEKLTMSEYIFSLLIRKALKFFGNSKKMNTVSVIILFRFLTRFFIIYGTYKQILMEVGRFLYFIKFFREINFTKFFVKMI